MQNAAQIVYYVILQAQVKQISTQTQYKKGIQEHTVLWPLHKLSYKNASCCLPEAVFGVPGSVYGVGCT